MTSNRPYHKRKTYEQAVEELIRCSSTQFDPEMVLEFVRMLDNNRNMLDLN
jgi:HD-GYP domain-containing protein (c-di-GMP phosphodiesterase class II)